MFSILFLIILINNLNANPLNSNTTLIKLNQDKQLQFKIGSSIEFECPTENLNQNYVISWFKNNRKIKPYLNSNSSSKRFIIQNISLKINYLHKIHLGSYHCELITGNGQIIKSSLTKIQLINNINTFQFESINDSSRSNINHVIQGERPVFFNKYDNQPTYNIIEGSKIELDCLATGQPQPQVFWYKNDKIISEEEFGLVRNSMILKLKDLFQTDSGIYRCHVFNEFSELNRTFFLNVIDKNKLVQTLNINETTRIKCPIEHLTNQNRNQIKWYAKFKDIDLNENENMIEINDESFTVLNLAKIDFYQLSYQTDLLLNKNFKLNPILFNSDTFLNLYQLNDGSLLINKASGYNDGEYICMFENIISSKIIQINVIDLKIDIVQVKNDNLQNENENYFGSFIENFSKTPVLIIFCLCIGSFILIISLSCYYFLRLKKGRQNNPISQNVVDDIKRLNKVSNSVSVLSQHDNFRTRRFSYVPTNATNQINQFDVYTTIYRSQLNPVYNCNYPIVYTTSIPFEKQHEQIKSINQPPKMQHFSIYQNPNHQSTRLNASSVKSCSTRSCSKSSNK